MKKGTPTMHSTSFVRAAKRPLVIVLIFLIVSMLVPRTAFADPVLPLSGLPICGDQDGSESPFSFGCADFAHYPDAQTYRVQGVGAVTFKADFVYRQAGYDSELGFFIADAVDGSIGQLKPGDAGYLAAALTRATIVFPSGSNAWTTDFSTTLTGGEVLVLFLVQDNTLANLLANNPGNEMGRSPLAFFSIGALNPDKFDHFVGYYNVSSMATQFGFEDMTNGGDSDYDDVVYSVNSPLQASTGEGILGLPFPHRLDNGLDYVWSLFDHQYPVKWSSVWPEPTSVTEAIVPYTGGELAGTQDVCEHGVSCYSGHDGVDFSIGLHQGFPVLAASGGTVTESAYKPDMGYIVTIDHGEYQTLYAHLKSDSFRVTKGEVVAAGDRIGSVGTTGSDSKGAHLHLSVYRDEDGDGQFAYPNELVDPLGWRDQCVNAATDPWPVGFKKDDGSEIKGAKSKGLWKFGEPTCARFVANKGHSFITSGGVVVSIPDGALPAAATLAYNIAPQPRSAGASATAARAAESLAATSISLDRTFQLSGVYGNGTAVTGFAMPVGLSVPYSDADLDYLYENTFIIYHWNDASASWEPLATVVDQRGNRATASADTTGTFSLRSQPKYRAPVIERVTPSRAPTGSETVLQIEGANFMLTAAVNLGMGGLEPQWISSSVLTAIVPAGLPAGQYDLMVHNPDGQTAVLERAVTLGERLYLPYILR